MDFFPSLKTLLEAKRPEALLVDLWGVIHDGVALYPGVVEGLKLLSDNKVKVVFLSNAPRRASVAEANLERLGITRDIYTDILTSGEAVFDHFTHQTEWASDYLYIGPEKDRDLLSGLPYRETPDAKQAAFALCTGFDNDDSTLAEKLPQLNAALAAKLPLICANPDMEVVRLDGSRALCAGVMAEWYNEQGGKVHYFGKPYPRIYSMAMMLLAGLGIHHRNTVMAVGDNLDTDIRGANYASIRSVLITGGVLKERLDKGEKLEAICDSTMHKQVPTFTLPGFR